MNNYTAGNVTASAVEILFDPDPDDPYRTNRRSAFDAIDHYVTPIWYVLGIPGNILACIVWIQRRMRPSSGCYLAALALDECVFLILQVFFELQTKWNVSLLQHPGLCELFPIFFLTCQQLSPLFVLGFTVERYISICFPFQRERYCTTRRTVMSILLLVFFSLAVNSVQGYFWTYFPENGECGLRPVVVNEGSGSSWSIYSWITEMIVFGVVPISILILNILVIRETRRLASSEEALTLQRRVGNGATSGGGNSTGSSRPSATTVMLLAVSSYLIATTLPVTILYVLFPTFQEGSAELRGDARKADPTWQRHYTYNEIRTVIDELGLSHYACNFYIYLLTGRIFRRQLRLLSTKVFCRGRHFNGAPPDSCTWTELQNTGRCGSTRARTTNNIEQTGKQNFLLSDVTCEP